MNPRKAALAVLLVALVAAFFWFDLGRFLTLDRLSDSRDRLHELYMTRPALMLGTYFVLYVLMAALSLPGATVMTLAGGAVFGFWPALFVVSFASALGATAACSVARYLLRDWVQGRFGHRLARFNAGVKREGGFYLFTLRLIPAVPFVAINLAMGLTPLPLRTFWWVSQAGMLPGTAVYVNAGARLGEIESLSGIVSWPVLGALVLLGLFPLAARKVIRSVRAGRGDPPVAPETPDRDQ